MNRIFCILFLIPLLTTCNSNKNMPNKNATTDCNTTATVVDMQDLDGCRFLLKVENGEKWLPLKLPHDFQFHDGQKVKFGYEEVKDYISICMAENKGVNITCIQETQVARPPRPECTTDVQVQKIDWMMNTIRTVRPRQITRYQQLSDPNNDSSKEGFLYYFESNTKGYLYTCSGVLICDTQLNASSSCLQKVKALSKAKIVWQRL